MMGDTRFWWISEQWDYHQLPDTMQMETKLHVDKDYIITKKNRSKLLTAKEQIQKLVQKWKVAELYEKMCFC
jgi:hypothetical protein